jgi:sec-independent protein translocase protein TatA
VKEGSYSELFLNRAATKRELPVRVGFTELLVILAIVLLMFGSKKLPELADGMGKAIRNFKKGINAEDEDVTPPAAQTRPVEKQVSAGAGTNGVIDAEVRPAASAERKS